MAITNETYGTMYYVDDMKSAVAHYKKLGFTPSEHSNDDWTEFIVGGHALCLHAKDANETYKAGGIVIFKADGIKALHEKLTGDKIKATKPKDVYQNTWTFHVEDPSGNAISFYGKG